MLHNEIEAPDSSDEESIEKAYSEHEHLMLYGAKDRATYESDFFAEQPPELENIPVMHAMDHRVRPPIIEGIEGSSGLELVRKRLERMLMLHPLLNSITILERILGVDVAADAAMLHKMALEDRRFCDLLLQGKLGTARHECAVAQTPQGKILRSRMAVYHGAFQLQLLTIRGYRFDYFPWFEKTSVAVLTGQLEKLTNEGLEIHEQNLKKYRGESPQASQKKLVTETLKPAAEAFVAASPKSEKELEAEAIAFLNRTEPEFRSLREKINKNVGKRKGKTTRTLHGKLFGLTSRQTLVYGASRLLQISDCSDLLSEADLKETSRYLKMNPDHLLEVDCEGLENNPRLIDLFNLVFLYRLTLLRDQHICKDFPDLDGLKSFWAGVDDFGHDDEDLKKMASEQDMDASGVRRIIGKTSDNRIISKSIIESRNSYAPRGNRGRLIILPESEEPTGLQRIDILVDFFVLDNAGVGGAASMLAAEVRGKKAREQKQKDMPDPRYRAPKRA